MIVQGKTIDNFRVIGVNTQACNNENWFLIENRYDPGDQLKFIVSELDKLEQSGGSAIFISHIPPQNCLHPWGERFRSIAERYQHVIKFSLYGHTHKVMYEVVRSYDNKNIGFNHVTGSMCMQPSANPSFTLVDIDQEFLVPLNFRVFVLDLPESNKQKTPIIYEKFNLVDDYGLADVSPDSMFSLSERILNDEATAKQYEWNKYRKWGSEPASCDSVCRTELFCQTTTTEEFQYEECRKTMPDIKGGALFDIVLNVLGDPWVIKQEK